MGRAAVWLHSSDFAFSCPMKQCLTCRSTYTDETLRYCLADGAALVEIGTEAETKLRSGVSVNIPPTAEALPVRPTTVSERSGSPVLKIVLAIVLLGILGVLGIAAAGVIYYLNTQKGGFASASPIPAASPLSTRDPEKERLEKELADLQKQLDENTKTSPSKTPPGFESDDLPTARVNSPGDGFLALRSEPNTEYGERLAQIPHGSIVTVVSCLPDSVKIGSRTGRWCLVTYQINAGWVFDAWLDYE